VLPRGRRPVRRLLAAGFLILVAAGFLFPAHAGAGDSTSPRALPAPADWRDFPGEGATVFSPPEAARMAAGLAKEAGPALEEIRRELGIPLPETIGVYLVNSPEAQAAVDSSFGQAPEWASGYAFRARPVLVLRTRTRYGPLVSELPATFRHELAHVVVDRYLGDRTGSVPRWFHEGVASALARENGIRDLPPLTLHAVFGPAIPFRLLDGVFTSPDASPESVRAAYVESSAFVRSLGLGSGSGVAGRILAGVRGGEAFEEAFRRVTGESLATAETSFFRRYRIRYAWVPILTSSFALTVLMTSLALWAGTVKRRRAAARLAELRGEEPDAEREWFERDDLTVN